MKLKLQNKLSSIAASGLKLGLVFNSVLTLNLQAEARWPWSPSQPARTTTQPAAASTPAPIMTSRPPQFVLLSYDGSKHIDRWQKIRNYSLTMKSRATPVDYTFFISGVYFLSPETKRSYREPRNGVGASSIGFSETKSDIVERVNQINMALAEGQEMGSHANGHYSGGSRWSYGDWKNELNQFNQFIFNVIGVNRLPAMTWNLQPHMVRGIRAPLLETNANFFRAIQEHGYVYDTSRSASPTYWPEKKNGVWDMPLADIRVAGTSKVTISMDYNFYYMQSKGVDRSGNKLVYKKQMYDSYINYFKNNYYGNRAPVNIGHHFSKWNAGAYDEALDEFAAKVCGLPEVRCVTFSEVVAWLENQSVQNLSYYKRGAFEKMTPVSGLNYAQSIEYHSDMKLNFDAVKKDFKIVYDQQGLPFQPRALWSVNGKPVMQGATRMSLKSLQALMKIHGLNQPLSADQKIEIGVSLLDPKLQPVDWVTHDLHNWGTEAVYMSPSAQEERALKGDLPEAHEE